MIRIVLYMTHLIVSGGILSGTHLIKQDSNGRVTDKIVVDEDFFNNLQLKNQRGKI